MLKRTFVAFTVLAVGCYNGVEGSDDIDVAAQELDEEIDETVENLKLAGFPNSEIDVLEDGTVIVGNDAVVTLEASREIAGIRRFQPEDLEDESFRQYSTNNLVGPGVTTICINENNAYTGVLSTALNNAIAQYNAQGLQFSLQRGGGGCSATINANIVGGSGGSAGFPSGGLPYGTINIGSGVASFGEPVARHVIMHEIGHCIGFRHSDYYDRSISCGSGGNEGPAGVGANLIPGTPATAVPNGSVMNACFNAGSTGVWTGTDVTALDALYGGGGNPPGGGGSCENRGCGYDPAQSCQCDDACTSFGDCCDDKPAECGTGPTSCNGTCGQNAGQCWCDAACHQFNDCCDNKIAFCGDES